MASVSDHYEKHLSDYYSWLFGGLQAKTDENRKFFELHSLSPRGSAVAVDLGAGSGFQSIPLARLGYAVTAIDLSGKLLEELRARSAGLQIRTVKDDLIHFSKHCPDNIELCICMGDTLTHLDSKEKIRELFGRVRGILEDGGKFILTFRDLAYELRGADRFIPVRSDERTIFTCFLEYEAEFVNVYDIVYEKTESGWHLKKSFYQKIRISYEWAERELERRGFCLEFSNTDNGWITLIARKQSTTDESLPVVLTDEGL